MEKDLQSVFNITKDNVTKYIDLRLKLLKIETYEKVGKVSSVLLLVLLVLFIVFFAVLFLFMGLGYYLGQVLDSQSLGMSLIGGLYLLILLAVILCRKLIMNKIFGLFISELMKEDDDNENK